MRERNFTEKDLEIIDRSRELIADPDNWIKSLLAADRLGHASFYKIRKSSQVLRSWCF